jgi:hypothetical protein
MSRAPRRPGVTPSYRALRSLACVHGGIYCLLLVVWLVPGLAGATFVLGMTHGLLWIALALLTLWACLTRRAPWNVFAYVAILATIIPLAGAFGYLHEERLMREPAG